MNRLAPLFVACACACSEPGLSDAPAYPSPTSSGSGEGGGGVEPAGGHVGDGTPHGDSGAGGAADDGGASPGHGSAPHVVGAAPILDAREVYPAPLWNGNGEEVIVEVSFSEPMDLESEFVFEARDHVRPAAAIWSADTKQLLIVARSDFAFPRPLADLTEYSLDLSTLVSARGTELDPNQHLRQGRLVFTTGRHDALLNHSCGHTFFGPFASVGSAKEPDGSAPDIGTTHTQYAVTLQEGLGELGGWVRANFVAKGQYRLYFDGETTVSVNDAAAGNVKPLSLAATPPACPGIAYELTLNPQPSVELFLRLEAQESPVRKVIVELVPDESSPPN